MKKIWLMLVMRPRMALDLKVGGEGMKGYYDKIVPQAAERLGKKFGARVGTTEISTIPREAWYRLDDAQGGVERHELVWKNLTRRVEGLEMTGESTAAPLR